MAYVKINGMTEEVRMDGVSEISVVAFMFDKPAVGSTQFRVKVTAGDYEWDCETVFPSGKFSFVPDLSLLRGFPESTTAEAVVTVYLENSELGTDFAETDSRTVLLTAFPETAKPVVSEGWVTLISDNSEAGYPEGVYVKDSRVKAVFDPSKIDFKYDTYQRSYRMKIGNTTVETDVMVSTVTSAVIPAAGEVQVRCYVVDRRGFETSETFTIQAETYTQPVISNVAVYRSDAAGVQDDRGSHIYIKADAGIAELGGVNEITKFSASIGYTGSASDIKSGDIASGEPNVMAWDVEQVRSYRVRISLRDNCGGYAAYTAIVPTTSAAFNVKPGGKGAAFGKYAEHDYALDIGEWDLLTRGILMGNVYMTTTENDPAVLFGGTWTQNTDTGLPFRVWRREE